MLDQTKQKVVSIENLDSLPFLKRKTIVQNGWQNDGDVLNCWVSEKGNFKVIETLGGAFDIYFGLYFNPNLIKQNVKDLRQITELYKILYSS